MEIYEKDKLFPNIPTTIRAELGSLCFQGKLVVYGFLF